jgi:Tol biopolymer transport system component
VKGVNDMNIHLKRFLVRILYSISGICLAGTLLLGCSGGGDSSADAAADEPAGAQVATQELVLGSNSSGNYEIYTMARDGTHLRQLTNDPAYDNWWPRISPDRRKILFYRAPAGEDGNYALADLMVMEADGANTTLLRAAGDDGWAIQAHAEWSPDGDELVMCGTAGDSVHVFVTNSQGTEIRQLTFDGTWNCDPSWSPDGSRIAFNRCTGECGDNKANLEIFTTPISGGQPTQLTRNTVADYDPYYAPDGQTIAWLEHTDPSQWCVGERCLGSWSIRIMNASGSNPRYVIRDDQINSKPAWSLTGDRIFFHRFEPGATPSRWRIFSIQPDGSNRTAIDPFGSGQSEYPAN